MGSEIVSNAASNTESIGVMTLCGGIVAVLVLLGIAQLFRGRKPMNKFRVNLGRNRHMICSAKGATVIHTNRAGQCQSWKEISIAEACRLSPQAAHRYRTGG